jgi:hypothetical protein
MMKKKKTDSLHPLGWPGRLPRMPAEGIDGERSAAPTVEAVQHASLPSTWTSWKYLRYFQGMDRLLELDSAVYNKRNTAI